MHIPKYHTIAGQFYKSGSLGKHDIRWRIQNTTVEECREYAKLLENSGFTLQASKEIPADYAYNVNLFYSYQKENIYVFIFWDASIHTIFITADCAQALPREKIQSQKAITTPTFTQMQLDKGGMCYVIQLSDGEFIVVDGGEYCQKDCTRLYEFLKEKLMQEIPTVALWIFTHSHKDHIGLATEFIAEYKEKVSVEAFAYQFPDCSKISVEMESVEQMKKDIALLEKNIQNSYPKANVYALHTGESYYLQGVEIEILWTVDDTYPANYLSFNDLSCALRLRFDGGKSILLLGDCMQEACRRMAHRYGKYLKSDILQVTHHGLIGGDKGLYQLVDPNICFWSVTQERFLGKKPNERYQWCLGEGGCDYNAYLRDETICKRTHYHASATTTIRI